MTTRLYDIYRQPEGALSHKWKHYFAIYERYLARFIGTPVRVLEIGVQAGGSLHMWREYFGDRASIIGVDISPDCKALEKDGFQIEIGDQGSAEFLRELKRKLGQVDVIIDDGSHIPQHQILALNELFPLLTEGGVFICEDVYNSYLYSTGSFIDYAKGLIDEIHGWWESDLPSECLFPTQLTKTCGGIFFHDGVVVLEKAMQEERFDLICGDFASAPPEGKPPPEGPYITRELLATLPTNPDGTTSLHRAPTPQSEQRALADYPPIGALAKRLAPRDIDIPATDPAAWVLCWGEDFAAGEDGLLVDGFIRSKRYFEAEPGTRFKCEFYVRASGPTGDAPFAFTAGPIALDRNGSIIQGAPVHPALSGEEGLRRGEAILEAANEAVAIYVGLQGPGGGPEPRALPVFEHIRLTRILD